MRCCEGQALLGQRDRMGGSEEGTGGAGGGWVTLSLLPRLQLRSKERSLVKQAKHARETEGAKSFEWHDQGFCPYTGTPLSRGRPGPRGRAGFLGGLGRRRPLGARGRAQPRSLCVSEDSSMKARFSLG